MRVGLAYSDLGSVFSAAKWWDLVTREIKHDVIRQTANASLPFIFFPFYRILT